MMTHMTHKPHDVVHNLAMAVIDSSVMPILLLDEIAAHLDKVRRAALFEEIHSLSAQAWMTGTDEVLFQGLRGRGQFYQVADATLARMPSE